MTQDNESINAHIRNGLTPFVNLINLLENKKIDNEMREKFIKLSVNACKAELPKLLKLGIEVYENENVWKKTRR